MLARLDNRYWCHVDYSKDINTEYWPNNWKLRSECIKYSTMMCLQGSEGLPGIPGFQGIKGQAGEILGSLENPRGFPGVKGGRGESGALFSNSFNTTETLFFFLYFQNFITLTLSGSNSATKLLLSFLNMSLNSSSLRYSWRARESWV